MSDYKDKSLKDFEKEWNRSERTRRFAKIKNAINIFPQSKSNLEIPDGPDVSTITEHIAFIIDDKIVEIMHCQPKLAAILLSEPVIVKIEDGQYAKPGWEYKDGKIISPTGQESDNIKQESQPDYLPTFREYIENQDKPKLMTFKEYIESRV